MVTYGYYQLGFLFMHFTVFARYFPDDPFIKRMSHVIDPGGIINMGELLKMSIYHPEVLDQEMPQCDVFPEVQRKVEEIFNGVLAVIKGLGINVLWTNGMDSIAVEFVQGMFDETKANIEAARGVIFREYGLRLQLQFSGDYSSKYGR